MTAPRENAMPERHTFVNVFKRQKRLFKLEHLLMNIDFFVGFCDHIESILSITINAIDTPATEANAKAHV